jgi:hypothetical protein
MMSYPTRLGTEDDCVVGALLVALDGPFGTAIITRVDGETVYLERPHCRATYGGTLALMVERYTTTYDAMRSGRWRVYTRGESGTLDQRGA